MRTLLILGAGLGLWLLCLGLARLLSIGTGRATLVFAMLWFLVAAGNLWIGVTQAGYSFAEELPIFMLIFLLPTAVALLVQRRSLSRKG